MAPLKCSALGADDRHRDRQHPGAEAAPVAHQDEVGYPAHGAKIGALNDGAEYETDDEAADADDGGCCKLAHLRCHLPTSGAIIAREM